MASSWKERGGGGNSAEGGLRDGRGAVQPPQEVVAPLLRLESTLAQL